MCYSGGRFCYSGFRWGLDRAGHWRAAAAKNIKGRALVLAQGERRVSVELANVKAGVAALAYGPADLAEVLVTGGGIMREPVALWLSVFARYGGNDEQACLGQSKM